MLRVLLVLMAGVGCITGHGVATSSQSMVSGEGWRYSYGIAHGPHGIGHAVGESFPHGYGGFGTYAPGYGYHLAPPPLPPRPVVVKLPPTYVLPLPPKPVVFPKPIEIVKPVPYLPYVKPAAYVRPYVRPLPYVYAPYQPHHLSNYVYLDEHDHEHAGHLHEHGHGNYGDLFDHHH